MAKPAWISVNPNSGSNSGTSQITVTAYTGRDQRTGTVTVTTTGGATDELTVTQSGKTEFITVPSPTQSAGATASTVTITGTSNAPDFTIVDGSSTISGVTYSLKVNSSAASSWNGSSKTQIPNDPGATAEFTFELSISIPENTTVSAKTHRFYIQGSGVSVKSAEIVITQQSGNSTLTITPETMTFESTGGTQTLTITSNDSWTLS